MKNFFAALLASFVMPTSGFSQIVDWESSEEFSGYRRPPLSRISLRWLRNLKVKVIKSIAGLHRQLSY